MMTHKSSCLAWLRERACQYCSLDFHVIVRCCRRRSAARACSKKEPQCRISALSLSHHHIQNAWICAETSSNASIVRCIGKKPICLPRVVSVPDKAPIARGQLTVCHFLWANLIRRLVGPSKHHSTILAAILSGHLPLPTSKRRSPT